MTRAFDQLDGPQPLKGARLVEGDEVTDRQQVPVRLGHGADDGLLASHATCVPRRRAPLYPSRITSIAAVTCSMSAMPSTWRTSPRAS